jgi:hypothetical protein
VAHEVYPTRIEILAMVGGEDEYVGFGVEVPGFEQSIDERRQFVPEVRTTGAVGSGNVLDVLSRMMFPSAGFDDVATAFVNSTAPICSAMSESGSAKQSYCNESTDRTSTFPVTYLHD